MKTKKLQKIIIAAIFLSAIFQRNSLYAQVWEWTVNAQSEDNRMKGEGITMDTWGNIYTIGGFFNKVVFSDTTLIGDASQKFYIVKHDKYGKLQWIKQYAGHSGQYGLAIKTDALGYIYFIAAPAASGWIHLNDTTTMIEPFIAKLNPNGDLIWVQNIPCVPFKASLDVDVAGNVYVIFASANSGYFGDIYINNPGETYSHDIVFGKFDATGDALWAVLLAEAKSNPSDINMFHGFGLDVNQSGSLCVSGFFADDTYAAILNAIDGSIIKRIGTKPGSGPASAATILADNAGNYVVGGVFQGTVNFGSTSMTALGGVDMFLASYNRNGEENWVKRIAGLGINSRSGFISDIGADKNGNYFICGTFAENSIFEQDTITAIGIRDAFIAKYDLNGKYYWVAKMGGAIDRNTDAAYKMDVTPQGIITVVGNYYGLEGFFGNDTITSDLISNTFISKIVGNNNLITGSIYMDNNNELRDTLEPLLSQLFIATQPSADFYAYTNLEGNFFMPTDTGTYTFTLTQIPKYHTLYPSLHTAYFNGYGLKDTLNDFRLVPTPNITDIEIDLTSFSPVRPGFSVQYQLTYKNVGTDTISGVVSLKIDSFLIPIAIDTLPIFQSSDSLAWSYFNLLPQEVRTIHINCEVLRTAVLNDTIFLATVVTPIVSDTVPTNNLDTLKQIVTGSYDPNDKIVFPTGDILIDFVQDNNALEYLIRFQNTGTDTAFTVIITDTIAPLLDLGSFKVLASSHNYQVELRDDRRIDFIFNNILLPDSTRNNLGSQGFIKYSIQPQSSTIIGDVINNTAHIYFDFNAPIVTNTTRTKVVTILTNTKQLKSTDEFNLLVYPNPSNEIINYEFKIKKTETILITLYKITGESVRSKLYKNSIMDVKDTINLQGLPRGIYVLEMKSRNNKVHKKIIIN